MRNTLTVLEFRGKALTDFLDTVNTIATDQTYPPPTRLRFALEDETGEAGEKPLKYAEDSSTWSLPFCYPDVTQGPLFDPEIAGDAEQALKCGCEITAGVLDTARCQTHVTRPF